MCFDFFTMNNTYTISASDSNCYAVPGVITSWITDASILRWPVGRCPRRVATTLGNGLDFILERIDRNSDGEALKAVYRQSNGCITLQVFND
jgi:hypothetical protein